MARRNLTWAQFEVCNDNRQKAFEDMCRRLFEKIYLKSKEYPHSDSNTPGIEVLPILEPEREDGKARQRISFQSKYTNSPNQAYSLFKESAKTTAAKYKGKLDRIYLFCNRTLNTTSKSYQEIVKIHRDAGIETEAKSNDEILDMVAFHFDIEDYFFKQRVGPGAYVIPGISRTDITISFDTSGAQIISCTKQESRVLSNLLGEKLKQCEEYALAFELGPLNSEIENLIHCGSDNGTVYYFRALIDLVNGKYIDDSFAKCTKELQPEVEWLKGFYNSTQQLTEIKFKTLSPITQVFAISKLFKDGKSSQIISLYENLGTNGNLPPSEALTLFYGLALLNTQKSSLAKKVLNDLYSRNSTARFKFFSICADIRLENDRWQEGRKGDTEKLANLLRDLNRLKGIKQYSQNEPYVASLTMEAMYYLGLHDQEYLKKAIYSFEFFSPIAQKEAGAQYFYALSLDGDGQKDKALVAFRTLNWQKDAALADRYMLCLVTAGRYDEALHVYDSIEYKTVQTEAIRLLSLANSNNPSYAKEVERLTQYYTEDIKALLLISWFTQDENLIKSTILPAIQKTCTAEKLHSLDFVQKNLAISTFARTAEIKLLAMVLGTIGNLTELNTYFINEIYLSFFGVASKHLSIEKTPHIAYETIDLIDNLAGKFLKSNICPEMFWQIKIFCARISKKPFSFLSWSKKLYAITQDSQIAADIVSAMLYQKKDRADEYFPYLEALQESSAPEHAILLADMEAFFGRQSDADRYAYKALYMLNSAENYDVYRKYLSLYLRTLHAGQDSAQLSSAKNGGVITFEYLEQGNTKQLEICLDPEPEFSNPENHSMGVEHISRSHPDFIEFREVNINQELNSRGKKLKVARIVSRFSYGFGFVLRKAEKNPAEFKDICQVMSFKDIRDLIDQLRSIIEQNKIPFNLLELYRSNKFPSGLPIDILTHGDYGNYVNVFKYLLFGSDEVLFAGSPTMNYGPNEKFIPSLSTLVLLSILDAFTALSHIRDRIIIPQSYLEFLDRQYAQSIQADKSSAGSLTVIDHRLVTIAPDQDTSRIWKAIREFCRTCSLREVSDSERISFKITENLFGEQLCTCLRASFIHLDALIVAKRERAVYLCDDAFFHTICLYINQKSINTASLLSCILDRVTAMGYIWILSKTNYVYVPFWGMSGEEFYQILSNTLKGKRKAKFYRQVAKKHSLALLRVPEEPLGCNARRLGVP